MNPRNKTLHVNSKHISDLTIRSSNRRSTRSKKSSCVPWYQRPILKYSYFSSLSGVCVIGIFALFLSIFIFVTSMFNTYYLEMAVFGFTHYGYHVMSYLFEFIGSFWVRNLLVLFLLFLFVVDPIILMIRLILILVLRKEHEKQIVPCLFSFAAFTVCLFSSRAGSPIFGYNFTMICLGAMFCVTMLTVGYLYIHCI